MLFFLMKAGKEKKGTALDLRSHFLALGGLRPGDITVLAKREKEEKTCAPALKRAGLLEGSACKLFFRFGHEGKKKRKKAIPLALRCRKAQSGGGSQVALSAKKRGRGGRGGLTPF